MMKLEFQEFLLKAKENSFWQTNKVFVFYGQFYTVLFFINLFEFLENKKILPYSFKNLLITNFLSSNTGKIDFSSALKQEFLGIKTFYWLGFFEDKKSDNLSKILFNYSGPNYIALFTDQEKILNNFSPDTVAILLPDTIDKFLFKKILNFFEINLSRQKIDLLDKIYSVIINLNLDQVFNLCRYLELISVKNLDDFYNYILNIVSGVSPSLNLLSQYFWSRKPELFFKIWEQVYKDYSDMFWVSYWSEQIWKAYFVCKFLQDNKFGQAKSLTYGLSYNFIKLDYKNYSLKDLQSYYQFIYDIDYKVKIGSTFTSLDLFYFKHFNKIN